MREKKGESTTRFEKVITITKAAEILGVSRSTMIKYMSVDTIISPSDWFRLPGGHIRIKESAILKLMKQ
ncbi:MAG: helix-turn-helix domain-containing protein [Deltaproteobacteria bacterium]|nr:helix-turn-helix domain-containing protein [Deltaproteobacteria bacterium]